MTVLAQYLGVIVTGFSPIIVGADALIGPMAGLFGEQALHSIENAKINTPIIELVLICENYYYLIYPLFETIF